MFGWFKKGNPPPGKTEEKAESGVAKASASAPVAGKKTKDELIAEAMANAKLAREAIGEETMGKITEILERQAKKAKLQKIKDDLIRKMETDSERMADEIKYMLQDDKNKKSDA